MRTNSSLLSRIEALEKRVNSRPRKHSKTEEAALIDEAQDLVRKSREESKQRRTQWEQEYEKRREWIASKLVEPEIPTTPAPEAVESLDEFEAWLGGVQDEN